MRGKGLAGLAAFRCFLWWDLILRDALACVTLVELAQTTDMAPMNVPVFGMSQLKEECGCDHSFRECGDMTQRRALYELMPVQTRTFREIWESLVHMNFRGNSYGPIFLVPCFQGKSAWTNGPESSSKVFPETGIGSWMAFPSDLISRQNLVKPIVQNIMWINQQLLRVKVWAVNLQLAPICEHVLDKVGHCYYFMLLVVQVTNHVGSWPDS